jgi:hypothetical protein
MLVGQRKGVSKHSGNIAYRRVRKLHSCVTHFDVASAGGSQLREGCIRQVQFPTCNEWASVVYTNDYRSSAMCYTETGPKWQRAVCRSHGIGIKPFTIRCGLAVVTIADPIVASS